MITERLAPGNQVRSLRAISSHGFDPWRLTTFFIALKLHRDTAKKLYTKLIPERKLSNDNLTVGTEDLEATFVSHGTLEILILLNDYISCNNGILVDPVCRRNIHID